MVTKLLYLEKFGGYFRMTVTIVSMEFSTDIWNGIYLQPKILNESIAFC